MSISERKDGISASMGQRKPDTSAAQSSQRADPSLGSVLLLGTVLRQLRHFSVPAQSAPALSTQHCSVRLGCLECYRSSRYIYTSESCIPVPKPGPTSTFVEVAEGHLAHGAGLFPALALRDHRGRRGGHDRCVHAHPSVRPVENILLRKKLLYVQSGCCLWDSCSNIDRLPLTTVLY